MANFATGKPVLMFLALLAMALGILARTNYRVVQMEVEDKREGNTGYAKNCGTVPFNMSWSPNPIKPSDNLNISIDYTFPHDLDGGSYDLLLYFHGDPNPFLELADDFTCDDIRKYIPCPVHKGLHFRISKVLQRILDLGSYPGDYDAKAIVKNKSGQELICIQLHAIIMKT